MIALTAGRNIPDSPAELVKHELDRFNSLVGPDVLAQLSDFLKRDKQGNIRIDIFIKAGRVEKAQVQVIYAIGLDGGGS